MVKAILREENHFVFLSQRIMTAQEGGHSEAQAALLGTELGAEACFFLISCPPVPMEISGQRNSGTQVSSQ